MNQNMCSSHCFGNNLGPSRVGGSSDFPGHSRGVDGASCSRTFYDTQMATANCVHPHAQLEQSWAHCEQLHEHHNAHWREHCAVLSTPRTVCRCTVFTHRTCGSSLALCVIPCHPCMRTCVWLLEWSLLTRLSTSSSSSSSSSSWCPPWCLMRSPWKIPCATPASGAWSLWTVNPLTGYEPKDMELTDANERNLATSSDIYFQNALDDTASFPTPTSTTMNLPSFSRSWSIERGEECLLFSIPTTHIPAPCCCPALDHVVRGQRRADQVPEVSMQCFLNCGRGHGRDVAFKRNKGAPSIFSGKSQIPLQGGCTSSK